MMGSGGLGIVMAVIETIVKKDVLKWGPNPTAEVLALVIPAYLSVSMGMGGIGAWMLGN